MQLEFSQFIPTADSKTQTFAAHCATEQDGSVISRHTSGRRGDLAQLDLFERPVVRGSHRITANHQARAALCQLLIKPGDIPSDLVQEASALARRYITECSLSVAQAIDCVIIGKQAGLQGCEAELFGRAVFALEMNRDYPPGADVKAHLARFLSYGVKARRLARDKIRPTYTKLIPPPATEVESSTRQPSLKITKVSAEKRELVSFALEVMNCPKMNGARIELVDQIVDRLCQPGPSRAVTQREVGSLVAANGHGRFALLAGWMMEAILQGDLPTHRAVRRCWFDLVREEREAMAN